MELNIKVTSNDGRAVMMLDGALDLVSRDQFRETARRVLASEHVLSVTVDLWRVSFIDSSGLGALTEILRTANETGIAFSISRPTEKVSKLLAITGLTTILPVTTTEPVSQPRPVLHADTPLDPT